MTDLIFIRIKELIPKVNRNWAIIIGNKMQKTPNTIRAYSRGERGIKSGNHVLLLKHLTTLERENAEEIKELTNS